MIASIKVYNRFYIENMLRGFNRTPSDHWYIISIYASNQKPLFWNNNSTYYSDRFGCKGFLSLQFDDVTPRQLDQLEKIGEDISGIIVFNREHAKLIINFLEQINKDTVPFVLAMHCQAGISRSGGVAKFTSEYFNIDFYDEHIRPNSWVMRLLKEEADSRNTTLFYDNFIEKPLF